MAQRVTWSCTGKSGHETKINLTENGSYLHSGENPGAALEFRGIISTHFVIQVVITFIHLLLSKIPLIFHVDMWIELSRFSLGKLKVTAGGTISI